MWRHEHGQRCAERGILGAVARNDTGIDITHVVVGELAFLGR